MATTDYPAVSSGTMRRCPRGVRFDHLRFPNPSSPPNAHARRHPHPCRLPARGPRDGFLQPRLPARSHPRERRPGDAQGTRPHLLRGPSRSAPRRRDTTARVRSRSAASDDDHRAGWKLRATDDPERRRCRTDAPRGLGPRSGGDEAGSRAGPRGPRALRALTQLQLTKSARALRAADTTYPPASRQRPHTKRPCSAPSHSLGTPRASGGRSSLGS